MPLVQTVDVPANHCRGVETGDIVRCGPVGAAWRVFMRVNVGSDVVRFTLHPVDAHDVPVSARVTELPMPASGG
jgi:hypothetical protein